MAVENICLHIKLILLSFQPHYVALESIGIIEYKGLVNLPDSYRPPYSGKEHMLRDFPGALPRPQQLAVVAEESQVIASDRLSRLSVGTLKLTEDEAFAVAAHTFDSGFNNELRGADNVFHQLNECLRERDDHKMFLLQPYLSYLFRALGKLPAIQTTVYRGIPAASLEIVREKYKMRTMVYWSTFTLTSTDISTAKMLARGPGGIIFRIDAVNGRRPSEYSYSMKEEEILLSPNAAFVVTAECHHDEDGYVLVDMLELHEEGYEY